MFSVWGRMLALAIASTLFGATTAVAQPLVRSWDEAEGETNISKPRISIQNLGNSNLNGFKLRYRFTTDPGKTPMVQSWYAPGGSASLQDLGGGLWDLIIAFPSQVVQPGRIFPDASGLVVGLHYTDWSAWDKSDDPSHQTASSLQINGKIVVEDMAGNPLAGSFPPNGVAGRPHIIVAAREEAMNEQNISRIRIVARNVGKGATDSLRLQYHFATEGRKVPNLAVYDAAGAKLSLHRISGRNWRVEIDYSGRRIGAGRRTSESGVLFALHYPDWSRWDKSNDRSNPESRVFVLSRDVVGETESDQVFGNVPTQEEFASNSDVAGVPERGAMVATAQGASYFLKPDGTVWGWGYANQYSRFGTASRYGRRFGGVIQEYPVQISELKDIRQITASGDHLLALDGNGVVWAVGSTNKPQVLAAHADPDKMAVGTCDRPCAIGGITEIVAVSTGGWSRNLALDSKGDVFQWGMPTNRNEDWVGPPQKMGVSGIVEIRSCDAISLARKSDGAVFAWNLVSDVPTQVATSGITQLACDDPSNGGLLLKGDGSLMRVAGPYASAPYATVAVTGLPAFATIDNQGSGWIGKALSDGSVLAWGGEWGVLPTTPTAFPGLAGATSLAASSSHALAVLADGTVWAVGSGTNGELGNGQLVNSSSPVKAAVEATKEAMSLHVESGNYEQELVYENNTAAGRLVKFNLSGATGAKVRVVYTTIPDAAATTPGGDANALDDTEEDDSRGRGMIGTLVVSNTAPLSDEAAVTTGTYKQGDSRVWKLFNDALAGSDEGPNEDVTAVCRKVVKAGDNHFYIWVPDDQWGSANGQMDATKIDRLAEKLATDNVSVYQSVRKLVGNEWGPHGGSNLLDENTTDFHVVLDDLDDAGNPASGVSFTMGYFWTGDVYAATSVAESNQALVIYLNSRWLGYSASGSWSSTGQYPSRVYSTMAHEMQHMVYFYQKVIRNGMKTMDVWPNEMLSVMTQEVLAKDLGWSAVEPAVSRFPSWITEPNHSFVNWSGAVGAYASVYSYGSMLFRNLQSPCEMDPGSNVCDMNTANGFHAILRTSNDGFRAIEDAFLSRGDRGAAEWLRMTGVTLAASGSETPDHAGFPAWSVAGYSMPAILPWSDTRFSARPKMFSALPSPQAVGTSIPVEMSLPSSGTLELTVPANTWLTILPNF